MVPFGKLGACLLVMILSNSMVAALHRRELLARKDWRKVSLPE